MQEFTYVALPSRVIFGSGTLARVGDEVGALGCSRALVLSTPEQEAAARALKAQLGQHAVGLFARAAMHTPVEVTEEAVATAQKLKADCVVALGGGSTTGLGKAIALRTDLPQIVVPTTYAGSEATPIIGETAEGVKTTQRTFKVLPETIVYDVNLTLTLPVGLTVTSGMNAIAHAVEALYTQDANPVTSMMAEEAIRAMAGALPRIMASPADPTARSQALYAAWLCGICLGTVGMSLHHKLCHVLGGTFDMPHSQTHTVVLPHAVAYVAPAAPAAMARLERAMGVGPGEGPKALYDLERRLDAPRSLDELGMPQNGLARVVEMVLAKPGWSPRPLEAAGLAQLLDNAFHGRPPATATGQSDG